MNVIGILDRLSIDEKICVAHELAIALGERINESTLTVDDQTEDIIWGHADGLSGKRLYNLRNGQCSVAASLAFNSEAEEQALDRDIRLMAGYH